MNRLSQLCLFVEFTALLVQAGKTANSIDLSSLTEGQRVTSMLLRTSLIPSLKAIEIQEV